MADDQNNDGCTAAYNEMHDQCESTTGYYCRGVTSTIYKNQDGFWYNSPEGYLFYPVTTQYTTCPDQIEMNLCPYGYYCPNSFEKLRCDAGTYCALGYYKPHQCSFGVISCPYKGLGEQLIWVLVIMFTMLLLIVMSCYYWRQQKVYDALDGKLEAISNVQDAQKYELLQEQERTNQMLDSLSKAQLREGSQPMSSVLGHRPTRSLSISSLSNSSLESHNSASAAASTAASKARSKAEEFMFGKIEEPLTITFNRLSLALRRPPHDILLNNIFGTIRPYQITALMGPSGAGKTTLLNLLRGAVTNAKTYGEITINFEPVPSLAAYRADMAFVPQDDVVYEELSVEDNITYSAMLFNRRGLIKTTDVAPMVSRAMKMLGIDFIKHSLVGGNDRKGISGGQRKRVSIAMEMMKEAALFFLDEPTSGLDSATSISVLWCLKELTNLGYNVVATLHQPRQEILDMLDHLILIAPGGRVVFAGSPRRLRDHFIRFGYQPTSHCNMADFMMDCLAGFVLPSGSSRHPDVNSAIKALCDWWQENKEGTVSQKPPVRSSKRRKVAVVHNRGNEPYCILFYRTFNVAYARQKKIYYRTFSVIVQTCFLLIVSGIAVGYLLGPVRLIGFGAPDQVMQMITGQLVFAIFTTSSGLKLFGSDYYMRIREIEGGVWLLPMFLGKLIASYVEYMFYPFAFLAGYYSVIKSNTVFEYYWVTFILLHMSVFGLANFVSILVPGKIKDLIMLGLLVVLWLFGGVQPPRPTLESSFPVLGPLLNYISPFRWSFNLASIIELDGYAGIWQPVIHAVFKQYGYNRNFLLDGAMLFVYAVVTNLLAYCALATKRNNFLSVQLCWYRTKKRFRNITGAPEPRPKGKPRYPNVSSEGASHFAQRRQLGTDTYDSGDGHPGDLDMGVVRAATISEDPERAVVPSAPAEEEGRYYPHYVGQHYDGLSRYEVV